jgi:hypothetical protein
VKEGEDNFNVIQMVGKKPINKNSELIGRYVKKKFDRFMRYKKTPFIERDLFYATLLSLSVNSSTVFTGILANNDPSFKTNSDVVNNEKMRLLKKYKNYLQAVKNDPAIEKYSPSPLKPEGEEEKTKVNKILNSPVYLENTAIKLKKNDRNIVINLDMEYFNFNFANETHQFLDYTYKMDGKVLKMKFQPYVLYNGTHLLPRSIVYQVAQNGFYLIKFMKLRHFNVTKNFYQKKVKEIREMEKIKAERVMFLF